jgi:hypothetical protein
MDVQPQRRDPRFRRAVRRAAAACATALLALWPAVAHADGPGYGGTADRLSVHWAGPSGPTAAGARGEGGSGSGSLVVSGLGFRGLSTVSIQVGDRGAARTRSDEVGEVRIQVPTAHLATAPGTSVIAIGRAPSGTTRTLIGAVPPRGHGPSPTDLVVGLAGGLAMLLIAARGGAGWLRRRAQTGSNR